MGRFLDFYRISAPSGTEVPQDRCPGRYRKLRLQCFTAATLGYSLYYVCRTSLNVMKQPVIDSGFLSAGELGLVGACLYWSYAIGKFVNGFLADRSNIKRFMATGLAVSVVANAVMGILGFAGSAAGLSGAVLTVCFAVMWGVNGWAQSMGASPAIVSLSRWFPLRTRGTYYGIFSASHNLGEGLSFIFVSLAVSAAGWQWGFFSAAAAGIIGVLLIVFFLHDTPESKGLPSIEKLSGESAREQDACPDEPGKRPEFAEDAGNVQKAVLKNPGVWILALASAFMYMSRYAINEWGMFFLQKVKGFSLHEAALIIAVNTVMGIIGTVISGYVSDKAFKGDRRFPAARRRRGTSGAPAS